MNKIKKVTQGNYQDKLLKMLNPETMPYSLKKQLLESGLSEQEFLDGVKKITKSTYKLAMNTPNQYLSNIDVKYTTKTADGHYPKLPKNILKIQQEEITEFFNNNMGQMVRALKYVDTDTLNQMMDKRTDLFSDSLDELNKLSDDGLELLGKLIKCQNEQTSKALTAKDKIQLCQIVEIYELASMNTNGLSKIAESGSVNIDEIKENIQLVILKHAGITEEQLSTIPKDKLKFNQEYSYITLCESPLLDSLREMNSEESRDELREDYAIYRKSSPKERAFLISESEKILEANRKSLSKEQYELNLQLINLHKNIDQYTDEEAVERAIEITQEIIYASEGTNNNNLFKVIRESVLGDFKAYISDESNIYGSTNAQTKAIFESIGLNYEKWLKPDIEDIAVKISDKTLTLKLWDRNPQEDLFVGNKTTCCTAIGTGGNGAATPLYLLNTSFNVIELYDSNGNVVGMSRVYMGEVSGKTALLMDNLEMNETFIKNYSAEQRNDIMNGFFEYANQYAAQVTGSETTPVYLYPEGMGNRFPQSNLKTKNAKTKFIGEVSENSMDKPEKNARCRRNRLVGSSKKLSGFLI